MTFALLMLSLMSVPSTAHATSQPTGGLGLSVLPYGTEKHESFPYSAVLKIKYYVDTTGQQEVIDLPADGSVRQIEGLPHGSQVGLYLENPEVLSGFIPVFPSTPTVQGGQIKNSDIKLAPSKPDTSQPSGGLDIYTQDDVSSPNSPIDTSAIFRVRYYTGTDSQVVDVAANGTNTAVSNIPAGSSVSIAVENPGAVPGRFAYGLGSNYNSNQKVTSGTTAQFKVHLKEVANAGSLAPVDPTVTSPLAIPAPSQSPQPQPVQTQAPVAQQPVQTPQPVANPHAPTTSAPLATTGADDIQGAIAFAVILGSLGGILVMSRLLVRA